MLKVTHIGNVSHVTDLVAEVLKITEQHIECDCRTCMTKMCRTIYSRSADIKTHIGCMKRLEHLLFTGECVIYHELVFHIVLFLFYS